MRVGSPAGSATVLAALALAAPLAAQQPCTVPAFTLPASAPNIFSEERENDLGDAIAEQLQRNFRVIEDDVTDYLRRIGRRLLQQLPPTRIRFQFYLVDVPEVNAFSFPGGRVYVTRKLVASTISEDELAGVVAHEIGHTITRQLAIDYTRLFQKVLGVNAFDSRADVFEKYHQLWENAARNPKVFRQARRDAEDEQLAADRVAVFLARRAGYNAEAYAQHWDRVSEVGGKTGSAFGDFFGFTKPEQRRLREMRGLAASLPASCAGPRPDSTPEQYNEWKAEVVAYTGLGRRESLRGVEWKRPLQPQLRGYVTHLKFSRDGRHLLAQDASSIFVLSREPLEVLFRIAAEDALPASFSPDSRSVAFVTADLRVEEWSVEEESRTSVNEITFHASCIQFRLSPDAKTLACVDANYNLTLFDVASGARHFEKRGYFRPSMSDFFFFRIMNALGSAVELHSWPGELVPMDFSPDGRYFLAAKGKDAYVAWDFSTGQTFKLPKTVCALLVRSFSFMEGGRLVGWGGSQGERSAVISFPAGEVQFELEAGAASLTPATRGNTLVLRPIKDYPAGAMNLETRKIFMASRQRALDLYDKFYVSERTDGVLFLFKTDQDTPLGRVALPQSPLPRLRAAAISADLKYIAVSEENRGAVWDLQSGERRILTRNFQGAQFSPEGLLFADFPKFGVEERMIARVDPKSRGVNSVISLKESRAVQYGAYLVEQRFPPQQEKKKGTGGAPAPLMIVSSAYTGKDLWSRAFPGGLPGVYIHAADDKAVLIWNAGADFVKEESKTDPALQRRIELKKERQSDYYLHIVQASSGKLLGKLYIETGMGSFRMRWAIATGDYVTIRDNTNRLLIYSLSTGNQIGRVFGVSGDLSPAAGLLAVENERGVITFYSLPSLEKRGSLVFSSPLSVLQFSGDGKRLFVLTGAQQAYLFDAAAAASSAEAAASATAKP